MNRLQVNPATATPAQLAKWLIADASDGAIHYWAEQYLFSLGEDEMRQMVRDAMPGEDNA
jgi:hypothetical protein